MEQTRTACYCQLEDWSKDVFTNWEESERSDIVFKKYIDHCESVFELLNELKNSNSAKTKEIIRRQIDFILNW